MTTLPEPIDLDSIEAANLHVVWVPRAMPDAEWAAFKLRETRAQLEFMLAEVDAYVQRVNEWAVEVVKTGEIGALARRATFLEAALKAYAIERRSQAGQDGKGESTGKTTRLPSATIATRKTGGRKARFAVTDEPALLAWAEANCPFAVETVKRVVLDVIRMTGTDDGVCVTPDGEVVPGVVYEPPIEGDVSATVTLIEP